MIKRSKCRIWCLKSKKEDRQDSNKKEEFVKCKKKESKINKGLCSLWIKETEIIKVLMDSQEC